MRPPAIVPSQAGAPKPPRELTPDRVRALALPAFLRAIGKREIRPGGSHGWKRCLGLLAPVAGERLLLVSTHWKRGRLPEGLDVPELAVTVVDSLPIETYSAGQFDGVVLEDDVAYTDIAGRVAVLSECRRLLRTGGRLVLHELMWRQSPPSELLGLMPEVWGRMPRPCTMPEYWELLGAAGMQPGEWTIGALPWLRRMQLLSDEGADSAAKMLWRGVADAAARGRFLAALDHLTEWERFYGWVGIRAGV